MTERGRARWVVLAVACLAGACENLLGLEHGVPASKPSASGGVDASGGGSSGGGSASAESGHVAQEEEAGSSSEPTTGGSNSESAQPNGGQSGDASELPQAGQGGANDCLVPGGQTMPLASGQAAYPRIAFSHTSSRFGSLWMEGVDSEAHLMFSLLSPADEQAPLPQLLEPVPYLYDHALTTAGAGFASAWIDQDSVVNARFITAEGTPDPLGPIVVTEPDALASNLALVDAGAELIVFWSDIGSGMMARTLAFDGKLGPAISLPSVPNTGGASAAVADDCVLVVWPTVVATDGGMLVFTGNLASQADVSIPSGGSSVAAGSGGFGVAGTLGDHAVFSHFEGSCGGGPVKATCQVPLPLRTGYVTSIAPSLRGYVVAAGQGEVELVEVTTDCRVLHHWTIDLGAPLPSTVTYPNITSAAELGFGLVWTERWRASNQPGLLARRFFGPSLCD